jgi:hypothetical protein
MEDIKLGLTAHTTPPEVARAEALLHDIATMLLRLPMHGHIRELHVRALRLKQRVSGWTAQVPEPAVHDTVRELVELHREARDARPLRSAPPSLVP